MSKTDKHVRSLKAVKEKFLESNPRIEEWITFTVDDAPDARKFRIHSPIFQTNAEKLAFAKASETGDEFEMAKALLGDQWDAFDRAGGSVSLLLLLLNEVADETTGTDSEGNPTTL